MILVTGSKGQLGKEIYNFSKTKKFKFLFEDKQSLNICNYNKLRNYFKNNKLDILINTAALTKVDYCEKNKQECLNINYLAVKKIVKLCKKYNVLLIHISTDYVYYGNSNKSYKENSKKIPKNVYGFSKYKADNYIKKNLNKFIIIRSGWIFSKNSRNFISFINDSLKENKKINLINNQFGNPTSARSLSKIIFKFIQKYNSKTLPYGEYNFCNYPSTNWYNFGLYYLKNIIKVSNKNIKSIKSSKLNLEAKRPNSTKLDCSKIIKLFKIRKISWKKELAKL